MHPDGEAFTAGVLEHLPSPSIGCPSAASYLRLAPGRWACAYPRWGIENREVALRFIASPPDGLNTPRARTSRSSASTPARIRTLQSGRCWPPGWTALAAGSKPLLAVGDDPRR